jgi:methionyl-tRNA formyltransferase
MTTLHLNTKRFILFGGGALLAKLSIFLTQENCEVMVVTSPRHASEPIANENLSFENYLISKNINLIVTENLMREATALKPAREQAIGLSFGAAWIFKEAFINLFEGRLLNLHGARLPLDRGAGGFSWQILRGNKLGCCLLHQVDLGVDTGPVVKYHEFTYPFSSRVPQDYINVYIEENWKFITKFCNEVLSGVSVELAPQMNYLSAYWPRLSTEHQGFVDWSWTCEELERFICAFDKPYRGASTFWGERRVFLRDCFVERGDGYFHPFQYGLVYRKSDECVFFAARDGALVLREVCDENGKNLLSQVQLGDRFCTPSDFLHKAKSFRAIYSPQGLKS